MAQPPETTGRAAWIGGAPFVLGAALAASTMTLGALIVWPRTRAGAPSSPTPPHPPVDPLERLLLDRRRADVEARERALDERERALDARQSPADAPRLPTVASVASLDDEFLHVTCDADDDDDSADQPAHLGLLKGTLVRDVPYDRPVECAPPDASVHEALELLALTRSSCVRVAARAGGSSGGVLDVTDATALLLRPLLAELGQPACSVVRACASVGGSLSMASAAKYMTEGYDYLKVRGEPAGILSQAGVLRWLHAAIAAQPSLGEALRWLTVGELAESDCTVPADTPARAALRRMLAERARAVALVGADGRMVGVLSLSDTKYLARHADVDRLLDLPSVEFVVQSRAALAADSGTQPRALDDVVRVRPGSSVLEALGMMVTHNVHSVFVVAPSRPVEIGVVRPSVLLRALLRAS